MTAPPDNTIPFATSYKRRPWFDGLSTLLALVPIVTWVVFELADSSYRAGRRNADNSSLAFVLVAVVVAVMVLPVFALLFRVAQLIFGRDRRVFFASGALMLVVATVGFCCSVGRNGWASYLQGMTDWAKHDVAIDAIRKWHATLPPFAKPTPVPPTAFPVEVIALGPIAVEQLPAGGGVVLQWGRLGAWGNSRKLFVGPDDAARPPVDPLHPWTQVAPGVLIGVQVGG